MKKSNRIKGDRLTARPTNQVRARRADVSASSSSFAEIIPPSAFRALVSLNKTRVPIDSALAAVAESYLSEHPKLGSLSTWIESLIQAEWDRQEAKVEQAYDAVLELQVCLAESHARRRADSANRKPIGFKLHHEVALALVRMRIPNLTIGYGESAPYALYWATAKERALFSREAEQSKLQLKDYLAAHFTKKAGEVELAACDFESIARTLRALSSKAAGKGSSNSGKAVRK